VRAGGGALYLSPRQRRRHKLRNLLHSVLLLLGMTAILAVCAIAIWGPDGLLAALLAATLSLLLAPAVSPDWVMRLYGAQQLQPHDFPEGVRLVQELAARAELPVAPRLYWVPSRLMNAFAVGRPEHAAIAVTDGLLRGLTLRELAGVLAHEISHVRNDDLWIMGLADVLSRLTSVMSWLGQLLLIVNMPLLLTGNVVVPWLAVVALIFAPTLMALLQLALSRAREYDADLDAAGLTGDPHGLAAALAKLERQQGRYWEEIFLPGRRMPDPSLLRTHPPTAERIRRLLDLYEAAEPMRLTAAPARLPDWAQPHVARPRWHGPGLWY
jgi:heat shock protein HtpX